MLDVLTSWDGSWYLRIVRHGYPRHVQPHVTFLVDDARAAFFPLYPMLVRAVDRVAPRRRRRSPRSVVNFVLGAIAVFSVGLLAKEIYGDPRRRTVDGADGRVPRQLRALLRLQRGPAADVGRGLPVVPVRRYWVAAGVLAALGTATRPNGLALVPGLPGRRVHRHLATTGVAGARRPGAARHSVSSAFQLFLGLHAGEAGVWFRVQREAWKEGTSFGLTAIRRTFGPSPTR